jgi:NitT/TauT family transport system substrate-binding protein
MMKQLMVAVMLVAGLGLSGCTPPAEPLRIVSSPWPGYEPLYLARDLGFLDSRHVRLSEMPSSNITWEAFNNGSADIATLTLDETLSLLDHGRQLRIMAVMDISNGADVVMARPGINSLPEIKGKRIGIVNIPLGIFMLARTLELAGLNVADVTVLQMPEDKHERAYLTGEIDVAITFEPFKTRIANAGAQVLFDSSQIPDEIFDLLVVREDVYNSRREEVCEVTRQWFHTQDYIRNNQQQAYSQMGKRLNTDGADFAAMLEGLKVPDGEESRRLLGGESPAIIAPATRLLKIMLKEKLLKNPVKPSLLIAPELQGCM